MADPVQVWTPAIAPADLTLYRDEALGALHGDLLIAGLVSQSLIRVELDGNTVAGTSRLLTDLERRVRAVQGGPDGTLYILTDHPDGALKRITPGDR